MLSRWAPAPAVWTIASNTANSPTSTEARSRKLPLLDFPLRSLGDIVASLALFERLLDQLMGVGGFHRGPLGI